MPYSSSLTTKSKNHWAACLKEARPPVWTKRQILDGALYQLKMAVMVRSAQRLAALLDCILAFAVALWGLRSDDGNLTLQGAWTSQKKNKMDPVANNRFASGEEYDAVPVCSQGFCHYKCTMASKTLAVDTLGLPFFTHCTLFEVSDDQGLIELLSHNLNYFRAKPVNIENYHSAWQGITGQARQNCKNSTHKLWPGQVWTRT